MNPVKPSYPVPIPENIPQELQDADNWVLWKSVLRDGKWTKVPYQTNGSTADADNPATWSSFNAVCDAFQCGDYQGIGFEFGDSDFSGVDLDRHLYPETGELDDYASRVIAMFPGSYMEESPSGQGIHLIVRGEVPASVNDRKTGTEMYSDGRFFTMTGRLLPGSSDSIADCTEGLRRLYDELRPSKTIRSRARNAPVNLLSDDNDLLSKAFTAKNGEKVRTLYNGNRVGYDSASEADTALAWLLAFYTGPDPERLERLMRSSGLCRDKWDEPRKGETWIGRECRLAVGGQNTFYGDRRHNADAITKEREGEMRQREARGYSGPLTEYHTETAKSNKAPDVICLSDVEAVAVEWLWNGRIPRGKLTLLDGDPGLGKTTLALEIAARLTRGDALPGEDFNERTLGNVLLITYEDGLADTIRPRLEATGADLTRIFTPQLTDKEGFGRLPVLPDDLPELEHIIIAKNIGLVIVDPLMASLSGAINSYRDQDVRQALARIAKVAEDTGAAFLVLRHLTKGMGSPALYRGQGSIGIAGAARSVLMVGTDPADTDKRVLAPVKSNLGKFAPSLSFCLESVGEVARVKWEGTSPYRADELALGGSNDKGRGARMEAADFLERILANGPMLVTEIYAEAQGAGISETTLKRASKVVGVKKKRVGGAGKAGHWEWGLSEQLPLRWSKPA